MLTQTGDDSTPLFIGLSMRIASAPFVTIAGIRGRTRDGDDLALAFDLRYASREQAFFSQPEVATGLVPAQEAPTGWPRCSAATAPWKPS